MERFSFSNNWNNKLNGDAFTTLRLSGRLNIGQPVEIEYKGQVRVAKVIDKKRLANIEVINDWMAYLDTGYNADECRAILKRMHHKVPDWANQPIYYYLLRYSK